MLEVECLICHGLLIVKDILGLQDVLEFTVDQTTCTCDLGVSDLQTLSNEVYNFLKQEDNKICLN